MCQGARWCCPSCTFTNNGNLDRFELCNTSKYAGNTTAAANAGQQGRPPPDAQQPPNNLPIAQPLPPGHGRPIVNGILLEPGDGHEQPIAHVMLPPNI